MNIDNDPARAALAYAERGWQVLPLYWPVQIGDCACGLPDCDSVGKHPISRLVPHGLHDASCRLGTVAEWWRSVPRANVGIRTGSDSGLVVIDVDGPAGRQALRSLITAHGPLSARWARTGGGGWHAYLSHPGATVPSSAGRIGQGLDVRGDGGYVVAPPSRHWTGRLYRWAVSPDCALHTHPAPMPRWLVDLATPPARRHSEASRVCLSAVRASAYAAAAVEHEAHEVARAPVGQRNDRLNRAAFRLGQLVGAGLLQETVAADALVAAGLAAGPGERKIRSTVRRGLQAGRRHPRQVVLHASQPRTPLP